MVMVATTGMPRRHPWLVALEAAPEAELQALVGGYADISPYGRAEPADAAVSLLFGLADEDPARRAFDRGCLVLLSALRAAIPKADEMRYRRDVATLDRLLAVIRRVRPIETVRDLHRRYAYWYRLVETAIIDRGLDLRREFWRVLALTQDMLEYEAKSRRLMPLWFEICSEAGPLGRYDETYLDVGLIGLRRLALGAEDDSNEEVASRGIARWAARQLPDKGTFLGRWYEIEAAYPRAPAYWPPLVDDVIATTEVALAAETRRKMLTFPAASWWRDALEPPQVRPGERPPPSGRKRPVDPPSREMHEAVLKAVALPIDTLTERVDRLRAAHRRYADATGDTYFLVRTACNVGMQLLKVENPAEHAARGKVAVDLAREALAYAPNHLFAWILWRNGLVASGAPNAAEDIGWESVRRFPEDPQQRTQLSTLIADELGRPEEAALLLRDTIAQFPLNEAARPQLATLLVTGLDQRDEARTVLREAIAMVPDHRQNYTQLATLLADRYNDRPGGIALLQVFQRQKPGDRFATDLLNRLVSGQPVRVPRQKMAFQSLPEAASDLGFDIRTARARRALFRAETGAEANRDAACAEVKRYLDEDRAQAYIRYVAQRLGVTEAGTASDTAFAFAFDRAARAGTQQAFEMLMEQTAGMDRYIAQVGLSLMSNAVSFQLPPGANDAMPISMSRRLAVMTDEISKAVGRPTINSGRFLRLVNDFAAARLATDLAA